MVTGPNKKRSARVRVNAVLNPKKTVRMRAELRPGPHSTDRLYRTMFLHQAATVHLRCVQHGPGIPGGHPAVPGRFAAVQSGYRDHASGKAGRISCRRFPPIRTAYPFGLSGSSTSSHTQTRFWLLVVNPSKRTEKIPSAIVNRAVCVDIVTVVIGISCLTKHGSAIHGFRGEPDGFAKPERARKIGVIIAQD